ncbi:MAG: hypothetical protein ACE5FT_02800 [Candidatus Nanoarchaeia archaeon]
MPRIQTLGASENIFEGVGIFIAIVGYLLAISARTPLSAYLVVLVIGLLLGRIAWQSHGKSKLPLALLLCAFTAGFLLGNVMGDPVILVVCMGIGIYWGHEVHKRKLIPFT